ncbi:MAG: BolA family transcriptional regulator [Pseudomonadota bacterium]|nr:BolA family transcriptional regulator [Pseudomonadota bacterium]
MYKCPRGVYRACGYCWIKARQSLDAALDPVRLEIDDESAHHIGHAGAATGGGHYTVTIVSERFRGRAMIARSSIMVAARRL